MRYIEIPCGECPHRGFNLRVSAPPRETSRTYGGRDKRVSPLDLESFPGLQIGYLNDHKICYNTTASSMVWKMKKG